MFIETVVEQADYQEVRITRDVLPENLEAFKRELSTLAGRSNQRLVLNFERVDRFCSWAIGVLAVTARQVRNQNGELSISHLSPNLRRIFRYARMEDLVAPVAGPTASEVLVA